MAKPQWTSQNQREQTECRIAIVVPPDRRQGEVSEAPCVKHGSFFIER
jgi:hypothetical protein